MGWLRRLWRKLSGRQARDRKDRAFIRDSAAVRDQLELAIRAREEAGNPLTVGELVDILEAHGFNRMRVIDQLGPVPRDAVLKAVSADLGADAVSFRVEAEEPPA